MRIIPFGVSLLSGLAIHASASEKEKKSAKTLLGELPGVLKRGDANEIWRMMWKIYGADSDKKVVAKSFEKYDGTEGEVDARIMLLRSTLCSTLLIKMIEAEDGTASGLYDTICVVDDDDGFFAAHNSDELESEGKYVGDLVKKAERNLQMITQLAERGAGDKLDLVLRAISRLSGQPVEELEKLYNEGGKIAKESGKAAKGKPTTTAAAAEVESNKAGGNPQRKAGNGTTPVKPSKFIEDAQDDNASTTSSKREKSAASKEKKPVASNGKPVASKEKPATPKPAPKQRQVEDEQDEEEVAELGDDAAFGLVAKLLNPSGRKGKTASDQQKQDAAGAFLKVMAQIRDEEVVAGDVGNLLMALGTLQLSLSRDPVIVDAVTEFETSARLLHAVQQLEQVAELELDDESSALSSTIAQMEVEVLQQVLAGVTEAEVDGEDQEAKPAQLYLDLETAVTILTKILEVNAKIPIKLHKDVLEAAQNVVKALEELEGDEAYDAAVKLYETQKQALKPKTPARSSSLRATASLNPDSNRKPTKQVAENEEEDQESISEEGEATNQPEHQSRSTGAKVRKAVTGLGAANKLASQKKR